MFVGCWCENTNKPAWEQKAKEQKSESKWIARGDNPENIIEIHGDAIAELRRQIDILAESDKNLPRCAICGKVRFKTYYLIECSELQVEELRNTDRWYCGESWEAIDAEMERDNRHNENLKKNGMPICERCYGKGMGWLAKQYYEKK